MNALSADFGSKASDKVSDQFPCRRCTGVFFSSAQGVQTVPPVSCCVEKLAALSLCAKQLSISESGDLRFFGVIVSRRSARSHPVGFGAGGVYQFTMSISATLRSHASKVLRARCPATHQS